MRIVSLRAIVGQLLTLTLLAPAIASAQSTNITGYVLLAEDSIRAKRLTVVDGDLGVTNGLFSSRTSLAAPDSDVAAGAVKFAGNTDCDALFANAAAGTTSQCQNPSPFANPFPDLADACGYPVAFPACNAAAPITVTKGQTLTLPPGVYGDVKVEGGSGPKASLILSGQTTICNLQGSREAKILFDGPSTLNVTGVITLSNAVQLGPNPGTSADDIQIFVAGSRVKASRKSKVGALLCAPNARFSAGTSAELEGRFVAKSIRLKRNRVSLAGLMPPTTTTTVPSSTTTTTTLPGSVCGNGIVEPGEECDGDVTCDSSPTGSFIDCDENCDIVDQGTCGSTTTSTTVASTTTTIASTTTTVPSSTTTTTTLPAVCGNGVVEPGEQCDGDVVCNGSATGSFIDCENCQIVSTGPCGTTTTTIPGSTTSTTVAPSTTSTTIASTTTTVPSSTTTTTLPAVCGNGVVEPGEQCDGDVACDGSATGSFIDCENCQIVSTGPCGSTTTSTTVASTTTTIASTTTTVPSSTTTTTTLPAVCGNGVVEPGEQCDGDVACDGSATGSFIDCENCQIVSQGPCGSTTTTTTVASSTTTTPTSTTTTTTIVDGPVCGNGVVEEGEACDDENTNACDGCSADCSVAEGCGNGVLDPACGEVCDGQDFGDATCPGGSPGGALLSCSETCDSIDTSNCQPLEVAEICGNCIDDDDNGMTDFEDPACCDGPQAFLGTLRRSNLKPKKNSTSQSFLRVKSNLATAGLMPSPMNEDVFLQIRDSSGTEILCAKVPAGKFMMMGKKKTFKFWDRKHMITSAQNIDDMKVSIKKNGTIKYAAYGKRVNVKTPAPGPLMVTVGFRDPSVGDSSNRCSSVTQPYRAGKKGAIRFP